MRRFYLDFLILILMFSNLSEAKSLQNKEEKTNSTEKKDKPENLINNLRVAVVDIQEVWQNSMAIQSVVNKIGKINEKTQKKFLNIEDDLKKMEQEIVSQKEFISQEEFKARVQEFETKVKIEQKNFYNQKQKIEHAHAKAISEIHQITVNIISELATKHNLHFVLPNSQILFFAPGLNMTEEVIENLNSRLKDIEIDYK